MWRAARARVAELELKARIAEEQAAQLAASIEAEYAEQVKARELDGPAASCVALESEATTLCSEIEAVRRHVGTLIERNGGTDEMYPIPLPAPSQYDADMRALGDALWG